MQWAEVPGRGMMIVDGKCPECGCVVSAPGINGGIKIDKCMSCGKPFVYTVKVTPVMKTFCIVGACELQDMPLSGNVCLDDHVYIGTGNVGIVKFDDGDGVPVTPAVTEVIADPMPEPDKVIEQNAEFKKAFWGKQLSPLDQPDKPMLGANMPKEKLVQGKPKTKVQTIAEEYADVPYVAIGPESTVQYRMLGDIGIEVRYMGSSPQIVGWDLFSELVTASKDGSVVERIKDIIGNGNPNRLTAVNRTVKAVAQGKLPEVEKKLKV